MGEREKPTRWLEESENSGAAKIKVVAGVYIAQALRAGRSLVIGGASWGERGSTLDTTRAILCSNLLVHRLTSHCAGKSSVTQPRSALQLARGLPHQKKTQRVRRNQGPRNAARASMHNL